MDYGAGNLTSVRKALAHIGAEFWTPADPAELVRARAVIVPGVGHFDSTARLDAAWRDAIHAALARSAPLFGICVGLQWLFEGSTEAPGVAGLGAIRGTCTRLAGRESGVGSRESALKVPHVGWNSLSFPRPTRLLEGIPEGTQVYFTHSFAAPVVPATAAITTYGVPFSAAVEDGLVSGVQFHPEKSGDAGLRILRNWTSYVSSA
ncbi:MAG: imidazole glycerol phosphate synthase subunit HisH [Vicinamibacterales bacterium]